MQNGSLFAEKGRAAGFGRRTVPRRAVREPSVNLKHVQSSNCLSFIHYPCITGPWLESSAGKTACEVPVGLPANRTLPEKWVLSGWATNLPELGSAGRGWAGNVVWPVGVNRESAEIAQRSLANMYQLDREKRLQSTRAQEEELDSCSEAGEQARTSGIG